MSISLTILPNGLRVITDFVPAVESVALGVWADVGARHEERAQNGIAHMVEHMMFKGTPTRSARAIAEQVEDIGGRMNAYTSREITAYHMHVLKEHAPLALDILSDMIQRPAMPDEEITRERGVILQEIGMTIDTPDDIVFDHYHETAYPDQALGAPILGKSEIVQAMRRDDLMAYVERFYTPQRLVISAAGNITHDEMLDLCATYFDMLPPDRDSAFAAARYEGGEHRFARDLEQSHIVLGFDGVSRHDDDFYAAGALATMLGGGMSSRLFQEIREKRGLVYTVFAHHTPYQDDGQFILYAGTGPEKLTELIPVLADEIIRTANDIEETGLARAKSQMRADMLMGRESMMRRANQQAAHLIHYGTVIDLDRKLQRLDSVTTDDVMRAARRIFKTRPTLAALGPLDQLDSYEAISRRFAG